MSYIVRVEENSHYGDKAERRTVGEYKDAEMARAMAMSIVNEDLDSLYQPGMTPEELYRLYTMFGRDAYIVTADESCQFSAWNYASERCREICSQTPRSEQNS